MRSHAMRIARSCCNDVPSFIACFVPGHCSADRCRLELTHTHILKQKLYGKMNRRHAHS